MPDPGRSPKNRSTKKWPLHFVLLWEITLKLRYFANSKEMLGKRLSGIWCPRRNLAEVNFGVIWKSVINVCFFINFLPTLHSQDSWGCLTFGCFVAVDIFFFKWFFPSAAQVVLYFDWYPRLSQECYWLAKEWTSLGNLGEKKKD